LIKPLSVFGAEPAKSSIRFAVLGDWGTGDDDQMALAKQMCSANQSSAFDFVVAAGDNIYPDGSGRHLVPYFERPFASLLRERVKFYAVLGNHDVEDGREDQCHYPLFNMGGCCYYTIKQGDGLAEFFMLDSTDCDRVQLAWFEEKLRESTAKWKVAVFHHPIYSSGKKHGSNTSLRKKIEPLLVKYGVKAAFSGHDHIYERTKPQNGIQYFVTGAGGKTRRGGLDKASGLCAASFDEDNHFMVVELNEHEMKFEAVCDTGKVVDSGIIKAS
jgi:predicted MPP superfamily phosphohydrolase